MAKIVRQRLAWLPCCGICMLKTWRRVARLAKGHRIVSQHRQDLHIV